MIENETSEPPSTGHAPSDRSRPAGVGLLVTIADARGLLQTRQQAELHGLICAAGIYLGVSGEVRIRLVPDSEMSRLHERHSSDPSTTDVLTFDMSDGASSSEGGLHLDADVIVCVDEAARQASQRSHAIVHELLLYSVHGILHCLGHDDHDEAGYAAMHAREDDVLSAIGVGPIFVAGARAGSAALGGGAA
ncbi:MAG: rRNA maturation RNase YbeY [Phycisphaerales bacterium]